MCQSFAQEAVGEICYPDGLTNQTADRGQLTDNILQCIDTRHQHGAGQKLRTAHLEADCHGSLGYGKVCAPNIIQRDLLLCNGSKQLLHSVLEAHGVDIQRSVQQVDPIFSQA